MDEDRGLILDEAVVRLNTAISLLVDSIDDFRRASGTAADPDLAAFLDVELQHREQLLARLQDAVRDRGELPEDRGTPLGAAQYVIGMVQAAVTAGDGETVTVRLAGEERRRLAQMPDGLPPVGARLRAMMAAAVERLDAFSRQLDQDAARPPGGDGR